jgi:hypothetical protein
MLVDQRHLRRALDHRINILFPFPMSTRRLLLEQVVPIHARPASFSGQRELSEPSATNIRSFNHESHIRWYDTFSANRDIAASSDL